MKPLPIPQREFAFVADTFGLIRDIALDGDRLARERDELEAARRANESAQRKLFPKRTRQKRSVKAKRHARHA
jgi:hypothetical protein